MFKIQGAQKEQAATFIDKAHPAMTKYYELLEQDLDQDTLAHEMQKLINEDPDFYEPYIVKAELLFCAEKFAEGASVLKEAYERAITKIANAKGDWPKQLLWEHAENRHILHILEEYTAYCWEEGQIETALEIFRRMLRMNPNDEQGIRYNVLAIKMGFDVEEWQSPFEVEEDGEIIGLDADAMHEWFEEHAETYPEEFQWLLEYHTD